MDSLKSSYEASELGLPVGTFPDTLKVEGHLLRRLRPIVHGEELGGFVYDVYPLSLEIKIFND